MFGKLLFQLGRKLAYLVSAFVCRDGFQPVAWTADYVMYGMQKLLLQLGKDVPPDDVVALALPLFDAVIRAAQYR